MEVAEILITKSPLLGSKC